MYVYLKHQITDDILKLDCAKITLPELGSYIELGWEIVEYESL